MKSLDEIAIECGTDKSSKGHSYTQYYSMFLEPIRNEHNHLLEIGIDKGASIKMWQEYMPNSRIYGIDLRGDYEYLLDYRTSTHIVDQSNKGELIVFARQFPDEHFNIIIDDGGHEAENQILSFETLFPYLAPGGYYCIEDCNCSNDKTRWGKNWNVYDRIKQMIDEVNMNGKFSNDAICANKVQEANKYNLNEFERNIEWVFNAMSLVIIKKMQYL